MQKHVNITCNGVGIRSFNLHLITLCNYGQITAKAFSIAPNYLEVASSET